MPPVPESHRLNKHTFFPFTMFSFIMLNNIHTTDSMVYMHLDLENVLAVGQVV